MLAAQAVVPTLRMCPPPRGEGAGGLSNRSTIIVPAAGGGPRFAAGVWFEWERRSVGPFA